MTKRILTVIMAIGMAFAVLLCGSGCSFDTLHIYKSEQCEWLQCYADRRGQENVDNQNWDVICGFVISGQDQIKRAKNRTAVDLVVGKMKLEIDAVESTKRNESQNDGVYCITDESWKAHVRAVAERIGEDESWIENVLNGGYPGVQWKYDILPKTYYYCVILNNKITVSDSRSYVYQISRENNVYRGDAANMSINFWVEEESLYLPQGKETLIFQKDGDYRLIENTRTLTAPKDIQISSGGEDFVFLRFEYDYGYGTHGIGIDIRKANENTYRTIKTEVVWMNQFVVQLDKAQFADGDNWVRLYAVGGPTIRNDKTMMMLENSEYVLFRVTIKGNKVNVREV